MIPLGYELGSGVRVKIPVNHTVVLGQTQLSGKTTTLEAMVTRSDLRAIGFITKPGEKSFRLQTTIPAFFSESTIEEYWKYVVAIVENLMAVKLGWQERGWIVKLCQDYEQKHKEKARCYKWKRPKSLSELLGNVEIALPHLRGTAEMICIQLREYLRPAIREIDRTEFSEKLELARGINVMDITELSDGLKGLVIRSVIEWVHKHGRKIVVIIPEAWKFIPEGRSTPVKLALEGLIREGAGVGNFVWMDSQDLRGVDKLLLRSVIVWLFGVQRQKNEVASTLASIPDHPKPSATEIMQLGKGEFYVCYGNTLVRTYVQPAGMEDLHAQAIARGEESPESWKQIVKSLDAETDSPREMRNDDQQSGNSDDERTVAQPEQSTSGSARVAAGDEEKLANDGDSEDDVWKEKYEALKIDYDNLVEAHDALAKRVKALEGGSPSQVARPAPEKAAEAPSPKNGGSAAAGKDVLGFDSLRRELDDIYRYVMDRAAKDPTILNLFVDRPELRVTREIKTVQAHASTLKGALGILISEKFFDATRPFDDVRREFIRRGFIAVKTPSRQIEGAIDALVEMGFLTKEETGLLAVPGMKINIVEARG